MSMISLELFMDIVKLGITVSDSYPIEGNNEPKIAYSFAALAFS